MGNSQGSCAPRIQPHAKIVANRNNPPSSSLTFSSSPSTIINQNNILKQLEHLEMENQLLNARIKERDKIIQDLQHQLKHCHCQSVPNVSSLTPIFRSKMSPSRTATSPKKIQQACTNAKFLRRASSKHSAMPIQTSNGCIEDKKQQIIDIVDVSEDILNENCDDVESCISIQRIVQALIWYNSYSNDHETLISKINNENYPHLLDDYHHVLNYHLNNSNKTITETRKEYEAIYNKILKHINKCSLLSCNGYNRYTRIREKEQLFEINESEETEMETKDKFYIDKMDTIHCYFMHSYDNGMRIQVFDVIDEEIEDDEKKEPDVDSDSFYYDHHLTQMRQKLKKYTSTVGTICNVNKGANKFYTQLEGDNEFDREEVYNFGNKYYYWDEFRENVEEDYGANFGYKKGDWYICQKYNNLKEEILQNQIYQLNKDKYEEVVAKAEQNMCSKEINCMMSNDCMLSQYYEKRPRSPIQIENIIVVILYCDYGELAFHFGATFRYLCFKETEEQLKQRNREYYWWSRILRETVELYGENICLTEISKFYHGVSHMIFPTFIAYFCAPTSTTTMVEVATTFSNEDGIILELVQENEFSGLRAFNCTLLSSYGNEEERLFFGGDRPLIFYSIRSMRDEANYEEYVKALTIFNHVIEAKKYDKKIKQRHYKIIDRLIKHYDDRSNKHGSYRNKFPKYVNQLFRSFVESKKHIKLNLDHIDQCFNGLKPLFTSTICNNAPLFDYLCVIFQNCVDISVWGTKNITAGYMKELLKCMESLNRLKLETLCYIKLYDVRYDGGKILDEQFVSKYERELQFDLKAYCSIDIDVKTRVQFDHKTDINNKEEEDLLNEIPQCSNLIINRNYDVKKSFQNLGRGKSECFHDGLSLNWKTGNIKKDNLLDEKVVTIKSKVNNNHS